MSNDAINLNVFRDRTHFETINIKDADVVSANTPRPDKGLVHWLKNIGTYKLNIKQAFTDANEARAKYFNKNINAIEAFKKSLLSSHSKSLVPEALDSLRGLAKDGKPLTGRTVHEILTNIGKKVSNITAPALGKMCYKDRKIGDPFIINDTFKDYCRNELVARGVAPSVLDQPSLYDDLINALTAKMHRSVGLTPNLEDMVYDIAKNTLDQLLDAKDRSLELDSRQYRATMFTEQGLTQKFEALWDKAVKDSPFGKHAGNFNDKEKQFLVITAMENTHKKPGINQSSQTTTLVKFALCDELLVDVIKLALEKEEKKVLFSSLNDDIKDILAPQDVAGNTLLGLLDKEFSKANTLSKEKGEQILKKFITETNPKQIENFTSLHKHSMIRTVYDTLLGHDPALKDFPCAINKAMADKLSDHVRTSLKDHEAINDKLLTEKNFTQWIEEPVRSCLKEIMGSKSKNLSWLTEQTKGLENKDAVRDLCAGLMGKRLFTEDIPTDKLENMLKEAKATCGDIAQKMSSEARSLVQALKQDDTKSIFKLMGQLQNHFNELPGGLDSHDRFTVYNALLDKAMASLPWDDVKDLRTADIKFLKLNSKFMKQDDDGFDRKLAKKLGLYAFHSSKNGLAGHVSTDSVPKKPSLVCMVSLVKRIGQAFVDENMPATPKTLNGTPAPLGKGVFNTVYKGQYDDGYQGVFKPISWGSHQQSESGKAIGIDQVNPNYHVRNVVARDLEEDLLKSHLLPDCAFTKQGGKRGILMDFRPGSDRATLDRTDLTLRREMVKLAFLDTLLGQVDRHHDNFTIQTENGKIVGVTGIDNDLCLGGINGDMDPETGLIEFPGANHALTSLPKVIEQADYKLYKEITPERLKGIVGDRLSPKELEALQERAEFIKTRLDVMNKEGLVLDSTKKDFAAKFNAICDKANSGNSYLQRRAVRKDFTPPKAEQ